MKLLITVLLGSLPGVVEAQTFPDISIDTTAKAPEFYEDRYLLSMPGPRLVYFWDLDKLGVLRRNYHTDFIDTRPGPPVGKWSLRNDSIVFRIEEKIPDMPKRKRPYELSFKVLFLWWNHSTPTVPGGTAKPDFYTAHFMVLVDNQVNYEELRTGLGAHIRAEAVELGINPDKISWENMIIMFFDLARDYFGKINLFHGVKVYKNGEPLKGF